MPPSLVLVLSLLLLAGVAAGCGPAPVGSQGAGVVAHGGPVQDYVSLVDALRAQGATVEPAGEVRQAFFSVTGQLIKVNGADVQVFEYADAPAAAAAAAQVSPDGSTVGTSMITWVAPPHFYQKEKLIVLYVGEEAATRQALEAVLGAQVAGR